MAVNGGRADCARADGIHADIFQRKVQGQAAGELGHGSFAAVVDEHFGLGDKAADGGKVDHAAGAVLAKVRQGLSDRVGVADDIGVEKAEPVLARGLFQRAKVEPRRVVDLEWWQETDTNRFI